MIDIGLIDLMLAGASSTHFIGVMTDHCNPKSKSIAIMLIIMNHKFVVSRVCCYLGASFPTLGSVTTRHSCMFVYGTNSETHPPPPKAACPCSETIRPRLEC